MKKLFLIIGAAAVLSSCQVAIGDSLSKKECDEKVSAASAEITAYCLTMMEDLTVKCEASHNR